MITTDIKIVIHYFFSIEDDKEISFIFKFQIIMRGSRLKLFCFCLNIYSTSKETHQLLFGAIMEKWLRNENIFYTIFFNNQLCIKISDNVTVLL